MAESHFSAQAQRDIKRKLRILTEGAERGNVSYTCRRFGISRDTFYRWKREYAAGGEAALVNCKPCPENPKLRTPADMKRRLSISERPIILGNSGSPGTWIDITVLRSLRPACARCCSVTGSTDCRRMLKPALCRLPVMKSSSRSSRSGRCEVSGLANRRRPKGPPVSVHSR
jgi:helix-turn-helix protein